MNDLKLPIEKYVLEVDTKQLSGRNRRLFYEWNRLKDYANQKDTISIFITDLNSTNGTGVNDELLEANQTVQLKSGDIVNFSEVYYRFV